MASVNLPADLGRSSDMARAARNPFEKVSGRVRRISAPLIGTVCIQFEVGRVLTSGVCLDMACLILSMGMVTRLTIKGVSARRRSKLRRYVFQVDDCLLSDEDHVVRHRSRRRTSKSLGELMRRTTFVGISEFLPRASDQPV
jgi:hypothetical protein